MRWSSISPFILNMLQAWAPAFQKSKSEERWTAEVTFVGATIGPAAWSLGGSWRWAGDGRAGFVLCEGWAGTRRAWQASLRLSSNGPLITLGWTLSLLSENKQDAQRYVTANSQPASPWSSKTAVFSRCAARMFKACSIWLFIQGPWPLSLVK